MTPLRQKISVGNAILQDEDESSFFTNTLSHFQNSENELQSKLQSEQTYLLTNKKRND